MNAPLAYEVDCQPVSPADFYAVACDPRRSVAVEACAGAGKTWMLVSRIVRALLEGTQPHEILAITFTKKAAGEMRGRLQEWLAGFALAGDSKLVEELVARGVPEAAAAGLVDPLRGLYARLLSCGRPVQIRTFHSWFAALLRTAPLGTLEQLGLPAGHELLEDDARAVERVWRRFHDRLLKDEAARQDYVASIATYGRSQTRKALEAALARRTEFDLADAQGVVDRSVRPWQDVFDDLMHAAVPLDLITTEGPVRQSLQAAARCLGQASQPSFRAAGSQLEQALTEGQWDQAILALLTRELAPRKFSDKLAGLEIVRAAQALAQRLCEADRQHQAWLHHQRLARLTRLLIVDYAAVKRDAGWIDMNDVERAALTLLSDPVLSGWVQERLDARVRHLLVDEFQDTNPLQWQALHGWLCGYAGAGGGRAMSVFIVGDPKQSIYRFRRAEPQVFQAAQRFIREDLGGALLGCDHTRRNTPQVLDAMNAVMQAAQEAGHYQDFRVHTTGNRDTGRVLRLPQMTRERAAAPAGDPPTGPGESPDTSVWRDSLTRPRHLPEEHLLALECRQAAAWVAGQVAAGRPPQDIMVLARRRNRLSAMQEALRLLGIAAQQPEKSDLGDAPEAQDVIALLDALVSPAHDLSLARALKSPVFGLCDDDLVTLARCANPPAGPPRQWLELLLSPSSDLPARLSALAEPLARWKRWVEQLPAHDALDAIFHDGDLLARFACATPPAWRDRVLANLRALLGAALDVEDGRYITPYAWIRAMRAGGIAAPAVAATGAVQLLTVHGAKGLEAPVVLMLDTDTPAPRAETMGVIVDWPGQAAAPLRFAFIASESRPPACCIDALAVEQAARQREELNGLYVAMTRACDWLVISSVEPASPSQGSWWSRLHDRCEPLDATPAPHEIAGAAAGQSEALPASCELLEVPAGAQPLARSLTGPVAGGGEVASLTSRFGQAVHRLVEGASHADDLPAGPMLARLAREFSLGAQALDDALAMARRILGGDGRWAWDPQVIEWAGNEVELLWQGRLLRLDRLVRRRDDGTWWVLDVKSASRPGQDDALRTQLADYVAAVRALHPGRPVRAAFLTGQGRVQVLPGQG